MEALFEDKHREAVVKLSYNFVHHERPCILWWWCLAGIRIVIVIVIVCGVRRRSHHSTKIILILLLHHPLAVPKTGDIEILKNQLRWINGKVGLFRHVTVRHECRTVAIPIRVLRHHHLQQRTNRISTDRVQTESYVADAMIRSRFVHVQIKALSPLVLIA